MVGSDLGTWSTFWFCIVDLAEKHGVTASAAIYGDKIAIIAFH